MRTYRVHWGMASVEVVMTDVQWLDLIERVGDPTVLEVGSLVLGTKLITMIEPVGVAA